MSPRLSVWIQLALATPVVLWADAPFFVRGWQSVVNRSLNMFSLIALGTGAAYLFSVVATLAPGLFPAGFRGPDGTIAVYFEPAAVITVLVPLGQVLELRAREQTGGAIRALLDLAPKTARRILDSGDEEEIPLDRVRSEIGCGCGWARAFRLMASSWKATASSTSRWSPASRCRSRKVRATT